MDLRGRNVRAAVRVVTLLMFLLFLACVLAVWAYTNRPAFQFRWGSRYTREMVLFALAADPKRRPMLYEALREDGDRYVRHWIIHYVSKKQFSEEDLYQVVRSLREDESWAVRAQAARHIAPLAHWDMEVALDALVDWSRQSPHRTGGAPTSLSGPARWCWRPHQSGEGRVAERYPQRARRLSGLPRHDRSRG